MFQINIYLRFALQAITIIGGILMWSFWGFWYGFPFLLIGLSLLIGYFLMGTIQSAAGIMQAGDLDGTIKRLKLTYFPALLLKPNKAYHQMLLGTVAGQKQDLLTAELHFEKAKSLGMQSDNERAMIYLQLASIAAQKNNWQKATHLYNQLKKFKVTEPQLKNQVKEFEKAIKQRGQIQSAQRMGLSAQNMKVSGKRGRPKMR
jgi:tetratricopeptide (TPR) repeat protein